MSIGPSRIVQAHVRLLPATVGGAGSRMRRYRPLVVGPAILHRPPSGVEPWTVEVSDDGRLLPLAPPSLGGLVRAVAEHRSSGRWCRVATALISPTDLPAVGGHDGAVPFGTPSLRAEFYGWSLMVQPPGVRGRAFVDPHEEFPDLPACFELPLELVDRIAHLEARGYSTRPIALITRPEDFTTVAGARRNRFRPEAPFHRPCPLDWLLPR